MNKSSTQKHNYPVPLPLAKRFFDIIFSVCLFFVGIPFLFVLFFWMIFEQLFSRSSRGPLFYCETRISGGKEFQFCKFRIFKQSVIDKERSVRRVVHTKPLEKNKNNLTYYGRFLKQVYMDEFPQLWFILKGDMTLVGPRPTNTENSKQMKLAGNYTKERMICGLTGPFQARKGEKQMGQRITDEEYINFVASHSGWQVVKRDIQILFKTIVLVFKAEGI